MASPARNDISEKEAGQKAREAYSKLPHDNNLFRQCQNDEISIDSVLATLREKAAAHRRKRSTKVLEGFHNYTSWMLNIAKSVDVAVQTSSGIGCPIWAPIKFVLMVNQENIAATEKILAVVQTIADNLPRLELYDQFHNHWQFQTALVNLFTDITEFSAQAYRLLNRRTYVRLTRLIGKTFDQELGLLVSSIDRRTRNVDALALALHQNQMEQHMLEAQAQARHENRVRAIHRLQPANMREYHDRNMALIANGTCEWILSHPTYDRWLSTDNGTVDERVLVIHGPTGCGKSLLASYIHDTLDTVAESRSRNNVPSHNTDRGISFLFSFSSGDNTRVSIASMAQTLLAGLIEQDKEDLLHDIVQRLMEQSSLSTGDLLETLGQVLATIPQRTTLIVDGIDECSESPEDLFSQIREICAGNSKLRLLLVGQSHSFTKILASQRQVLYIQISSSLIQSDIESVIRAALAPDKPASEDTMCQEIVDRLIERADGMFLWVRLMIDYLNSAASTAELKNCLENLPDGLDQAYILLLNRLSERISRSQRRLVQRLFSLIIACARPLDFEELQFAYAVSAETDMGERSEKNKGTFMLRLSPDETVRLCGGLVTYDNRFHIVHNSAREFLVGPTEGTDNELATVADFRVSLSEAHFLFSNICLKIFNKEVTSSDERTPLTNYASLFAAYHLKSSGQDGKHYKDSMRTLLQSNHFLRSFEEVTSGEIFDAELQYVWENLVSDDTFWAGIENELQSDIPEVEDNAGRGATKDPLSELVRMIYADAQSEDEGVTVEPDEETKGASQNSPSENPTPTEPVPGKVLSRSSTLIPDAPIREGTERVPQSNPNLTTASRQVADVAKGISSRINASERRDSAWSTMMLNSGQLDSFLITARRLYLSKAVRDPFTLLWAKILETLDHMSPFLMCALTWYCLTIHKYKEALTIGEACSRKLEHSDTLVRLMHDIIMHAVYVHDSDYDKSITHLKRATASLERPKRRPLRKLLHDPLLALLSSLYVRNEQYAEAKDVVKAVEGSRYRKLDNLSKGLLHFSLAMSHYYTDNAQGALDNWQEFEKLYKNNKHNDQLSWHASLGYCFGLAQFRIAQSLFELHRDEEALAKFKEFEELYSVQRPRLIEEEDLQMFDYFLASVDWYRWIMSEPEDSPLVDHNTSQGQVDCRKDFLDYRAATIIVISRGLNLKKRAEEHFNEAFAAYDAAHLKLKCETHHDQRGHAWHMSAHFLDKALVLHEGLDWKGAVEASFSALERFLEHCHHPAWSDTKNAEDIDLDAMIFNLSIYLNISSEAKESTKLAAYARRISSHFSSAVPTEVVPEGEEATTRDRLIFILKKLWELPVESSSFENVSKETQDRIELLNKIQKNRFEKQELRAIYRHSYSLLLPDSWGQAEELYLPARDRGQGGRWAEWP